MLFRTSPEFSQLCSFCSVPHFSNTDSILCHTWASHLTPVCLLNLTSCIAAHSVNIYFQSTRLRPLSPAPPLPQPNPGHHSVSDCCQASGWSPYFCPSPHCSSFAAQAAVTHRSHSQVMPLQCLSSASGNRTYKALQPRGTRACQPRACIASPSSAPPILAALLFCGLTCPEHVSPAGIWKLFSHLSGMLAVRCPYGLLPSSWCP